MKDLEQSRENISLHVQFSLKIGPSSDEGELRDLSETGGRLFSKSLVPPAGAIIELNIFPGDDALPLVIEKAIVQWTEQKEFGVIFYEVSPDVRRRIKKICNTLA